MYMQTCIVIVTNYCKFRKRERNSYSAVGLLVQQQLLAEDGHIIIYCIRIYCTRKTKRGTIFEYINNYYRQFIYQTKTYYIFFNIRWIKRF